MIRLNSNEAAENESVLVGTPSLSSFPVTVSVVSDNPTDISGCPTLTVVPPNIGSRRRDRQRELP